MSRANSRSSSKLASRISMISTAKTPSRLNTVLDDFDMRVSTPTRKRTAQLLCPTSENPEYSTLLHSINKQRHLRRIDVAAITIQKTFRSYLIRTKIQNIIAEYKKRKNKKEKVFLNIFYLNSTLCSRNRRKIFYQISRSTIYFKRFFQGYKLTNNEVFAATGMIALPSNMDQEKIIKFVHLCYASKLRNILAEWHLTARKSRRLQEISKKFKLDQMGSLKFGSYYTCFVIWMNFSRLRHNREASHIELPPWKTYVNKLCKKQRQMQKADEFHLKTIKENTIQALRDVVIHNHYDQQVYRQSVNFHIKKSMKLALAAWVQYLIIQQNKSITLRFVIRRWLQATQRRKHLLMLLETFRARHDYFQKRAILNILAKNRKVSQVFNVHQYMQIMKRPSLALYFISILRKDAYSEAVCHTFSAWISLVRRRRRWLHFVFMNEVTTEYTPKKKLILAGLRRKIPPSPTPICMHSNRFKEETINMYQNVMNEKVDPKSIYLIVNGDTPDEVKQAAAQTKTHLQQREVFFKIWESQEKTDFSLFMRSAIIYSYERTSQNLKETEALPDIILRQYKKVIHFLGRNNLGSDKKFRLALNQIEENNKKALLNRKRCLHRDNLIILTHDSHNDAIDLHEEINAFLIQDGLVKQQQIIEASENLANSYQPIVSLQSMGAAFEQPNDPAFVIVNPLSSRIKSYKPIIVECHKKIHKDLLRSEIGQDVASKFDRLLAGRDVNSQSKTGAHSNTRVDPYFKQKTEKLQKRRPGTGVTEKLDHRFPKRNRKAKIIGKETEQFHFNLSNIPLDKSEEENQEEEQVEEFIELDKGKNQSSNSLLSTKSDISKASIASTPSKLSQALSTESKPISHKGDDERISLNEKRSTSSVSIISDLSKSSGGMEIDKTLIDGFDKSVMLSLKQASDLKSPRVAKKYKQFLEILFGRTGKEANNAQINALRRKIIGEYQSRKPSLASSGVTTQGITRPVSALVKAYRQDKNGLNESDSLSSLTSIRNKQKDRGPNIVEDQPNEYMKTYNSRRFRFREMPSTTEKGSPEKKRKPSIKPKTEKTENGNPNQNEEYENDDNDYEPEDDDSFREDLMNEEIENHEWENEVNQDENEHFEDDDFDPAAKEPVKNSDEYEYNEYEYEYQYTASGSEDEDDGIINKNNAKDNNNKRPTSHHSSKKSDKNSQKLDSTDKSKLDGDEISNENENGEPIEKQTSDSKNRQKTRIRKKSVRVRKFLTQTPFTSQKNKDTSAISQVNKIAIALLQDQIREEGNEDLLVEIDQETLSKLSKDSRSSDLFGDNAKPNYVFTPSYKDRKRISVPITPNKRMVPIIVPTSSTMTPEMAKTLREEDEFNKLLLVNGKSQYIKNKKSKVIPFFPEFKLAPENEEQKEQSKSPFIQDQVVSFASGKRSAGLEAPNFMNVRIQHMKQRHLIKPLISTESELQVTRSKDQIKKSMTELESRQITRQTVEMVNGIVHSLLFDSNQKDAFEMFRNRARLKLSSKKNPKLVGLNTKAIEINKTIYENVVEINTQFQKSFNFFYATNHLLDLQSKFSVFSPILMNAIENAKKDYNDAKKRSLNVPKPSTAFSKRPSDNAVDIHSMEESPDNYDYNAVAVHYKNNCNGNVRLLNPTVSGNDNIDAIVTSTHPKAKASKKRARTELQPSRNWDDVLKEYNIGEMMLVTPYVVSEQDIDNILNNYQ